MLLRIIDKSDEEGIAGPIEIVFESDQINTRYHVDAYETPFSKNFRSTLTWYFKDYLYSIDEKVNDRGVAGKIIKFGQYLGDQFLGEDDQLCSIVNTIEEFGYQNLQVRIESSKLDFFGELWETVIFQDSSYVLAAVANSFVRKITGKQSQRDYPELCYELKLLSTNLDPIKGLEQVDLEDSAGKNNFDKDTLNIFHVVSRPSSSDILCNASNALNSSFELLKAEGAVHYETGQFTSWAELKRRIEKDSPHILHFDGSILINNDLVYFCLGEKDIQVKATEFVKFLVLSKVAVLSVDMRDCTNGKETISVSYRLARIAKIADQLGLGNVIGLSQRVDSWVSQRCFTRLYCLLATGLSFGQAVVETRKSLQATLEMSQFTSNPLVFHSWPLLNHYGGQELIFFKNAQKLTNPEESVTRSKLLQRLLGFKTQFLSPFFTTTSDGQLHSFLTILDRGESAVALTGEAGIGKTHWSHLFSLYLLQSNQIDYGFYFDFNTGFYSSDTILEMVAPIIGVDSRETKTLESNLNSLCCCFVLDNVLDINEAKSEWSSLNDFICRLISDGHIVIVTGNTITSELFVPLSELAISSLNPVEQKILSANCLRESKLIGKDRDHDWNSFLARLSGNPFLIKNVIPQLTFSSVKDLISEIENKLPICADAPLVEAFYLWQWDKLSPIWKKLLLLCTTVEGLLLEMLMVVCDQMEQYTPAKSLWCSLEGGNLAFSEGLETWENSGFIHRLPYGRVVDSRAFLFLQKKYKSDQFSDLRDDYIQLLFSQLVCEGIRRLSLHVVNQQNDSLSNDLLMKRRHWVVHFERLWFAGDFQNLMAAINAFKQVMQQANIGSEIDNWSLDLLGRSPLISMANEIEAKLSWLSLATMALSVPEAKEKDKIKEGVKICLEWFHNLYGGFDDSVDKASLPLLQLVMSFLELFYKQKEDWQKCIFITQKAYSVYQRYEAWSRAISTLKSLSNYYVATGDITQARFTEEKLFSEISYNNSPPGFESRQMLDTILSRVARGDYDGAKILLDQVKNPNEVRQINDMINRLQATQNPRPKDVGLQNTP